MKKSKFKAVIYLISFTVILTVGIQVYRNIQNYELNKQRFMNEVQAALDNGIESYYADKAGEKMVVALSDLPDKTDTTIYRVGSTWRNSAHVNRDSILKANGITTTIRNKNTKINFVGSGTSIKITDSLNLKINPSNITSMKVISDTAATDDQGFRRFYSQLFIAFTEDLDYKELHATIRKELDRKNLDIEFALIGTKKDSSKVFYNDPEQEKFQVSTLASSTYQLGPEKLEMWYTNPMTSILKRGLTDFIISILISLAVIGALLYLYKIINQQKQLAEIKNDLISNITHEFKTPIATVATAVEAISHFNAQNDLEKTKKYLDISDQQLKKLNVMVEKLLETATLDTGALELNKTPVNLSILLHTMVEKYSMVTQDKHLELLDEANDVVIEADAFHLENAISNLIDNAIKYGGNQIRVSLARHHGVVQVVVQDDGGFIEKGDKERVFDKFYRVPKGNRHDVKGFGIGLYYTKKIIEKHGGTIELILGPESTSFEIAM